MCFKLIMVTETDLTQTPLLSVSLNPFLNANGYSICSTKSICTVFVREVFAGLFKCLHILSCTRIVSRISLFVFLYKLYELVNLIVGNILLFSTNTFVLYVNFSVRSSSKQMEI